MRKDINEWDVGEIRKVYEKGMVECVVSSIEDKAKPNCGGCAFHSGRTCTKYSIPRCTPKSRRDKKNVKFIKLNMEEKCKKISTKLNTCLNSSQH